MSFYSHKAICKVVSFIFFIVLASNIVAEQSTRITPQSIALVNHYIHANGVERHNPTRVRHAPKIVLFLSLGMPTLVLRQYFKQAHLLHIPVVLRGMYEGNMHETGKRLYDVLNPKEGKKIIGGAQIDPLWFRQYDIKVVPALVASVGFENSVVFGNVPIKKQLQLIKQKSSYAPVRELASTFLEGKTQ